MIISIIIHFLIFQVQDDLRQLREKIAQGDTSNINIQDLEKALVKTEEGLQVFYFCLCFLGNI